MHTMCLRRLLIIITILLVLSVSATSSSASSSYTVDTYINPGSTHVEGFNLAAGSTFGWEIWVATSNNINLSILDNENYQLMLAGEQYESLYGPVNVTRLDPSMGYLTVLEDDKYWLALEASGTGPAEVSITLIDVPLLSTDFGHMLLMVLQGIGIVVLSIFILVGLMVLRGRLKRDRESRYPSSPQDDCDLQNGEKTETNLGKDSKDDYKAIDPFLDDPYIRSRPFWRRR